MRVVTRGIFIVPAVLFFGLACGIAQGTSQSPVKVEILDSTLNPQATASVPQPSTAAVRNAPVRVSSTTVQNVPVEVPVTMPAHAVPAPVPVVPAAKPQGKQRVYTVWLWQESGDCLWNLAKKYYGDPWKWKKIYLANKNQIEDPSVIYPRQVLIIPPLDDSEK
jgi:nucleoid-associated protein YgaU